ncbi:MAG: RIP metalloprotease [Hyphomonadaceae bacterium]
MIETLKNILIYGGSFIAVLSVVVFVHEFGHFQVARWCGVAVRSFSFGMGPALFQRKDKRGTTWKISAIPLGGYVSWMDDSDPTSVRASEEAQQVSDEEARRRGYFRAKPLWARAAVTAAGPISNFIFAILAFAAILMIIGRDVTDRANLPARIDGVMEGSAAASGGVRAGDVVVAVDGQPIASFAALQERVAARAGQPMALTVERAGEPVALTVTPGVREIQDAHGAHVRVGFLGIERRTLPEERQIERVGPIEALRSGAEQTWMIVAITGAYVRDVFVGRQSAEHIAGPLGILDQSGKIADAALSQENEPPLIMIGELLMSLLQWAAVLSVAVGIVNLLPIPILDGGHLLFYAIEGARGGKPLPLIAQEWAFRAGIAVMGALFLFATWNDIHRRLG